jgi:methylase of polypeptide subunit release factors
MFPEDDISQLMDRLVNCFIFFSHFMRAFEQIREVTGLSYENTPNILELGTGSWSYLLMTLHYFRNSSILGIERDDGIIEIARRVLELLNLSDNPNIKLAKGDMENLDNVSEVDRQYELIYIKHPTDQTIGLGLIIDYLEMSRDLTLSRNLFDGIRKHLTPEGFAVIVREVYETQSRTDVDPSSMLRTDKAVERALFSTAGFINIETPYLPFETALKRYDKHLVGILDVLFVEDVMAGARRKPDVTYIANQQSIQKLLKMYANMLAIATLLEPDEILRSYTIYQLFRLMRGRRYILIEALAVYEIQVELRNIFERYKDRLKELYGFRDYEEEIGEQILTLLESVPK